MTALDFDDILQQVGSFGAYQKFVLAFVLFPATLPCAFISWNQLFMSGTPSTYHCKIPGRDYLTTADLLYFIPNSTKDDEAGLDKCRMFDFDFFTLSGLNSRARNTSLAIVPCKYGWTYDTSVYNSTVVTEWNLVCDKELYVTHAYTINAAGGLFSIFFIGYIADRYGRRVCYFMVLVISLCSSIATAFTPNYTWFAISRFFVGVGTGWTYMLPVMIGMELIGPAHRALLSVVVSIYYTVGMLLLGGMAYWINTWRWFALVSCLPMVPLLGLWWSMPESPRYLLSQKRYDKLADFLREVARRNSQRLEPDFDADLPGILKKINQSSSSESGKKRNDCDGYSMLDLFRTPNLRKKTLILIFANVCNLGVYLGLTLYGPSINDNPHWDFFLSGIAEMPGYLLTSLMCDRLGRRFSIVSTMVMAGSAGIVAACVSSSGAISALVFVSKMAITVAFLISELLEDEIFPTVVRAEGHSVTAFSSNFFTLGVSYLVFLGHQYAALPLLIFGGICLVAAFFVLFLPETANTDLPQTLEDAELSGKNVTLKTIFSFKIPQRVHHDTKAYLAAGTDSVDESVPMKQKSGSI
ncbi:hypothetical protein RvY_12898 [Ramazzottius varieornatus]|uniref:Major facilitator superfamily (MFS) profile domain-containing protein n=1 Tax=Ramazzottius varieornatus TaxID=947166 RepID=A0A1D1VQ55_RAMVA|nr:hypothetical protein RvY_12898 [Ramazzottius varieornatus]